MKTQHTPGPWTYSVDRWPNGEFNGSPYIYAPNAKEDPAEGRHVASLCKVEEVDSNARLIAAAPDLLAALKACVERMAELQEHTNYPLAWPRVMAADAIAKAEGKV